MAVTAAVNNHSILCSNFSYFTLIPLFMVRYILEIPIRYERRPVVCLSIHI